MVMVTLHRRVNSVKRFKSGTCLFAVSMMLPFFAYGANPAYDELIIQARKGIASRC